MINFNHTSSKNYRAVQRQLSDLVQQHLDPNEFSETITECAHDKLNFTWFIRQDADVLMSHGVADKNYYWMKRKDTKERYVNSLKAILVPGEWMRERMLKSKHINLPSEAIIPVGWPRLDLLRELQSAVSVPDVKSQVKLLWAPTHDKRKRGSDERSTSSYPEFEQDVARLSEHYELAYSLHPRNRKDKEPTVDKLLRSNVVISDFGTMVYEAWALGKPVIFPRWILQDSIETYLPNSAEAFIFKNKIGYHPNSYEEMLSIIESGPEITPDVDNFMKLYLLNYKNGLSAKIIANTLQALSNKYIDPLW